MIKCISHITLENILTEYFQLESNITWSLGNHGKQCSLQYQEGDNPFTSVTDDLPNFTNPKITINPFFIGSIFEKIILDNKWKNTRLMWLNSKSCYRFHKDPVPRHHIPLITNNQCFLIFKSGLIKHLASGFLYYVDTRLDHSAMNGGNEPRLHLIGDVFDA